MTREELLKSPEFWKLEIQMKLHDILVEFMKNNNINRKKLSERFGFTKGYISQILNGEYDHKISKLIELSLAVGKAPIIEFEDMETILMWDEYNLLDEKISERPIVNLNINFNDDITIIPNLSKTITIKSISNKKEQISLFDVVQEEIYEKEKSFA